MTFTHHAFSAHSLAFKLPTLAFISTQFTSFHNQRQRIKAPCLAHSIFNALSFTPAHIQLQRAFKLQRACNSTQHILTFTFFTNSLLHQSESQSVRHHWTSSPSTLWP